MKHRSSEKYDYMSSFESMPYPNVNEPPYPNTYATYYSFEERMPEARRQKDRYASSYSFEERMPEPEAPPRKVEVVDYGYGAAGHAKNGKRHVKKEEDVNAEAEEFILVEHKKFRISKSISINQG